MAEKGGSGSQNEQEAGGPPLAVEHVRAVHDTNARPIYDAEVTSREAVETFLSRYGQLPPDHPAQRAVQEALDRLHRPEDPPIRIAVLPDMEEINAMAVGQSVIFVSMGMLKSVRTYEALVGVIGHERQHLLGKDMERTAPRRQTVVYDTDFHEAYFGAKRLPANALVGVGQRRLQEHVADLKGAMLALDQAGVNPLGYREFLSQLEVLEQKTIKDKYGYERPGLTHGRATDRLLTSGLLLKHFDLSSSKSGLTEIADDARAKWTQFERPPEAWLGLCVGRAGTDAATRDALDASRRELFLTLPLREQARILELWNTDPDRPIDLDDNRRRKRWKDWMHEQIQSTQVPVEERPVLSAVEQLVLALVQPDEQLLPTVWRKVSASEIVDALEQARTHENRLRVFADVDFFDAWAKEQIYSVRTNEAVKELVDQIKRIAQAFQAFAAGHTVHAVDAVTVEAHMLGAAWQRCRRDGRATLATIFERALVRRGYTVEKDERYEGVFLAERLIKEQTYQQAIDSIERKKYESLGRYMRALVDQVVDGSGTVFAAAGGLSRIQSRLERDWIFFLGGEKIAPDPLDNDQDISRKSVQYELLREKVGKYSYKVFGEIMEYGVSQLRTYASATVLEQEEAAAPYLTDIVAAALDDKSNALLKEGGRRVERFLASCSSEALELIMADRVLTFDRHYRPYSEAIALEFASRLARMPVQERRTWLQDVRKRGIDISKVMSWAKKEGCREWFLVEMEGLPSVSSDADTVGVLDALSLTTDDVFLKWGTMEAQKQLEWKRTDRFNEKVQRAFSAKHGGLEYLDQLIERDMRTRDHFEQVHVRMKQADMYAFERAKGAGAMALGDLVDVGRHDPIGVLRVLLVSGENDMAVREMCFSVLRHLDEDLVWRPGYLDSSQDTVVTTSLLLKRVAQADAMTEALFGLDAASRLYVVKRLLVDAGLLRNQEGRKQLGELLTKTMLSTSEAGPIRVWVERVLAALTQVDDWETLFYAMGPLLSKQIARRPKKRSSWFKSPVLLQYSESNEIDADRLGSDDPKVTFKAGTFKKELAAYEAGNPTSNSGKALQETIQSQKRLRAWLESRGIGTAKTLSRLSSMDLIRHVASNTGAMSIRFLQVLRQYIDVPPEHQEAFEKLFDQVEGQSKYAAISVATREWPEFWQTVESVEDRIGGGSLMSVYKARLSDGREAAMRVVNPNVELHVQSAAELFKQVIGAMRESGDLSDDAAARIERAVGLVSTWIREDISFQDSEARDARFKAAHDGQVHGAYTMRVPERIGPANEFVQCEAFVDGHNLTRWDILERQGHDMKQVVSALARDTVTQILNGLVHSDLHPGNIRLTKNKEIVYLDRSYLLELSNVHRDALMQLVSPAPDVQRLIDALTVSPEVVTDLERALTQSNGLFDRVRAVETVLRAHGADWPLSFTLILRNLHALNGYAVRAGFADVRQALEAE